MLPIFIDHKIAADPALPGLTEETLTITTTAIFGGWVVGSLFLQHLMSAFDKAQLIVAGCIGLLMVALATATLPHLTAGNLAVFTAVRFVQGLLQNIVFLETVYVQEAVPPGWGNAALVSANVGFCLVDILQAFLCGGPMLLWGLAASGVPVSIRAVAPGAAHRLPEALGDPVLSASGQQGTVEEGRGEC